MTPSELPVGSYSSELVGSAEYDYRAIERLLQDAFSCNELRRFCRNHPYFSPVLNRLSDNASLLDITDALIQYSDRRRLFPELLDAIRKVNPRQFEHHRAHLVPGSVPAAPYEPLPPRVESAGHFASEGLRLLVDFMPDPQVRSEVVKFQTDFQACRHQLGVLANCKAVHDLLHDLQLKCHKPILEAATNFPHDDKDNQNLERYETELDWIVDGLSRLVGGIDCKVGDTSWLEHLRQAQASLAEANRALDIKSLQDTSWHLHRVLPTQSVRINQRLITVAAALRLPELLKAMTHLCDGLDVLHKEPAMVGRVRSSVDHLDNLDRKLTPLIEQHDHWQSVDLELQRIEDNMSQGTAELEKSWPYLRPQAAPLYRDNSADWAVRLRENEDKLDTAIAVQNPAKMRRHFGRYHTRARHRFHEVDKQLKALCDELSQVGEALDLVVGCL